MKGPFAWILVGIGIAGILCGFVARRAASPEEDRGGPERTRESANAGHANAGLAASDQAEPPSPLRSSDTLGGLLELGGAVPYPRLALWLLDAPPEEIAAYWQFLATTDPCRETAKLVMIFWTRVDPPGATRAVAGTKFEKFAWWAWAAHDPGAALEAAVSTAPSRMPDVALGIGEFHPAWLRGHFGELNRDMQAIAFERLLAEDTETAIEKAAHTEAHSIAIDRLSATVSHLLATDPTRAFEVSRLLFSDDLDPLNQTEEIRLPGGAVSVSSKARPEIRQLLGDLVMMDPAETMLLFQQKPKPSASPFAVDNLQFVVEDWTQYDPEAADEWFDDQAPSEFRDRALGYYLETLEKNGRFEEAAMRIRKSGDHGRYTELLFQWRIVDPESALNWLDQADMPEELKTHLRVSSKPQKG